MPNVPHNPGLPKKHPILSSADEIAERRLHQIEQEDIRFNQEQILLARDASLIQMGISEKIARQLVGNNVGQELMNRVVAEKVNSDLYRAVAGNGFYEFDRGEDPNNYLGSLNFQRLNTGLLGGAGQDLHRLMRSVPSMLGGNNYVQAWLEDRFGANPDLVERRRFVLQRLRPELNLLALTNPVAFNFLSAQFGIQPLALFPSIDACLDDWFDQLMEADLAQLIQMRNTARNGVPNTPFAGGLDLAESAVFADLMMLVNREMHRTTETGVDRIYNTEDLRNFCDELQNGPNGGYQRLLMDRINLTLTENSLFPLDKNTDGKSLIAEIRARYMQEFRNYNGPIANPGEGAAQIILNELDGIRRDELVPEVWNVDIAGFRNGIETSLQALETGYNNIRGPQMQIAAHEAAIGNTVPPTGLQAQLIALQNQMNGMPALNANLQALLTQAANLTNQRAPFEGNLNGYTTRRAEIVSNTQDIANFEQQILNLEQANNQLQNAFGLLHPQDRTGRANNRTNLANNNAQIAQLRNRIQNARNIINGQTLPQIDFYIGQTNQQIAAIDLQLNVVNQQIAAMGNNNRAVIQQQIDAANAEILRRNTEINNLRDRIAQAEPEIARLEEAYSRAIVNLRQQLINAFGDNPNTTNWANWPLANIRHAGNDLGVHMQGLRNNLVQLFDMEVADYMQANEPRQRVAPIVLLQRFLRRQYLRDRGLQTNIFSEEANNYASTKAGLRAAAARTADTVRSANNKAAEFANRGRLRRGAERLATGVQKVQDFFGLEPIEFKTMSADTFLEQIIDSDPNFSAFRGINKFSTTRDVREYLNKSGQNISSPVAIRFRETLREAINEFKKVTPNLDTRIKSGDWDIEGLINVLEKFEEEKWNQEQLDDLERVGGAGNREQAWITLMSTARQRRQQIMDEIMTDVKSPNAMWRRLLMKNELKKILDKDILEANHKIASEGIGFRRKNVDRLSAERDSAPEGSALRARLEAELAVQENAIRTAEKEIAESKDLFERVEAAKQYIEENNLGRKEKKIYLEQVGLTQVFKKMGTNFALQRYWKKTKALVSKGWEKTKDAYKWSRENFLHMGTAKKGFSVARLAATPITWPLGLAAKAAFFPFRMVGRGLQYSTHIPRRLLGTMSKSQMRIYLRNKIQEIQERIAAINAKQAKLKTKMENAPYSWDKRRLMKPINKLETEKVDLNEDLADFQKMASDRSIELGNIDFYQEGAGGESTD